ncbi:GLPGLI family protein [Faecalibacter rhinopitheci]|uniref:GLPGLI family protein n=1 Tax=Faecalibacter rhinopitheci TaxID=2779678 RepID=A0A8J7FPN7_9FLAO|nr:GLPGLI family protein [Faecalibacter rhinopitheci]MBF0597099.1 GLPGLI family protein [Faecalibacter rhinopitheci]
MKQLLFILIAIGFQFSFAQTKKENIRAIYTTEFILNNDIIEQLPAAYKELAKAEIAKGIFVDFELESNGEISSFKPEIKLNNSQNNDGLIYREIIASEANPLYKDYNKNEFYNVREFGGKTFLIKDQLTDYKWKLTRERSTINGFNVTKANGTDDEFQNLVVWYSNDLPYRDGPYRFANLPGLIVKAEFNTNEFKTIFTLKEIQILDKSINISLPTKGKIVTDQQFSDEVEELTKRYKEMNQGVDTSK